MCALYSAGLFLRMQSDPAFRAADDLVRSLLLRLKLEERSVEGFENLIRDPRSTFLQIANAQFELDQARKRLADLRTEFEAAKKQRDSLLEK